VGIPRSSRSRQATAPIPRAHAQINQLCRAEQLIAGRGDERTERRHVAAKVLCGRVSGDATARRGVPERGGVRGVPDKRAQSIRPGVAIREALAQLLQPMFDSGLDTSRQQERLRDFLDGLLGWYAA
jgi:hypothetical protein